MILVFSISLSCKAICICFWNFSLLGDSFALVSLFPSSKFPRKKRNFEVSKSVAFLDGINLSPPSLRLGVVDLLLPPGVKSKRPGDLFGVLALTNFGVLLGVFLVESFNLFEPDRERARFPVRSLLAPDKLTILLPFPVTSYIYQLL